MKDRGEKMKSGTFLTMDNAAAPVESAGAILEGDEDEDETLSVMGAGEAADGDMDAMAEEAVSLIPCRALKPDQRGLVFFFLSSG